MKQLKNSKGFTLVELIVVIAVLALLAVGAVLAFQGVQTNARRSNLIRGAGSLATAINSANASAGGRADAVNFVAPTAAAGGVVPIATLVPNPPTAGEIGIVEVGGATGTDLEITVPAGSGLGAETITISFASSQERAQAMSVVIVTAPTVLGAPSVASVNNTRIEGWDGRAAIIP
jgi:prepilin-type N-terminal cleavage/methylation domain-containing protein